jgi:hypothetical protein
VEALRKTEERPAVFRQAREVISIAESDRAPEIGRALDSSGREANQKALIELIRKAQAQRLVAAGDPDILAGRYFCRARGGAPASAIAARAPAAKQTGNREPCQRCREDGDDLSVNPNA